MSQTQDSQLNINSQEQQTSEAAGSSGAANPGMTPENNFGSRTQTAIATLAMVGIAVHLLMRQAEAGIHFQHVPGLYIAEIPLWIVMVAGGFPLVSGLLTRLVHREFGSDLLAGISIVTSILVHQPLAGSLVVLMLSGGEALEAYATRSASSVLQALARRMPNSAKRMSREHVEEVPLDQVIVGDRIVVYPHALCPVDGTVLEGHGAMDESYLTGEPFSISKAPGASVLSGAINGEALLTIRCDRPAADSRYARIMRVMQESEQQRPHMRRLADQLGAWYTPLAVGIALCAWAISGSSMRFLAVLVVATPCPLLIAIPIAIIGSISLAARHGIIIKDPSILETISTCDTAIFDKTGTLTYGRPVLTEVVPLTDSGLKADSVLSLVASMERYSKHPLAGAILIAAQERNLPLHEVTEVRELPGIGVQATIGSHDIHVMGRAAALLKYNSNASLTLPPAAPGMECAVVVDGIITALFRFRDEPRSEGAHFIGHLMPKHGVQRIMLVSGDRESEVAYLAQRVGISEIFSDQSPEQKLELVRAETAIGNTIFLGDGINDAPALTAATVGIAFGNNSEITGEAADAIILDSSLERVDILFHIGQRLRSIALQSAIGGMAFSLIGMGFAATGHLAPVAGAVLQEVIDVLAVTNALRAAIPPRSLSDC